ncbi:hypothetical protein CEXT_448231 [Caerostris extrusa]|uniref:Uncharacterized protein n=1 Tax=Caerostris extrusa TaxID=172846 RepID=A0AAV4QTT9_CAEEX|nr:hypothetical protein CEXT_448231 [Caerostris extrusa]
MSGLNSCTIIGFANRRKFLSNFLRLGCIGKCKIEDKSIYFGCLYRSEIVFPKPASQTRSLAERLVSIRLDWEAFPLLIKVASVTLKFENNTLNSPNFRGERLGYPHLRIASFSSFSKHSQEGLFFPSSFYPSALPPLFPSKLISGRSLYGGTAISMLLGSRRSSSQRLHRVFHRDLRGKKCLQDSLITGEKACLSHAIK